MGCVYCFLDYFLIQEPVKAEVCIFAKINMYKHTDRDIDIDSDILLYTSYGSKGSKDSSDACREEEEEEEEEEEAEEEEEEEEEEEGLSKSQGCASSALHVTVLQ